MEEGENGAKGRICKYTHFALEQRVKIMKYAAESGNTAAVRHLTNEFPAL